MRRAPAAVWRRSGPQPHGLIFSKDPSLPQCFLAQLPCPSGTDAVDHQHSNPGDEPQGHQAGKNVDTLHSYLLVLRTFGFAGDALGTGFAGAVVFTSNRSSRSHGSESTTSLSSSIHVPSGA